MAGSRRASLVSNRARLRALGAWTPSVAVVVAILAFYAWSLHDPTAFNFTNLRQEYYSLQVHGWAKGSLALDALPHPDLQVEYPNRITKEAPYLLDASYYEGRYHLYFGPVPALVLMLPYHLITGYDLAESFVAWVFMSAGFLLSIFWLMHALGGRMDRDSARRWFPAAILGLGLASAVPTALSRPLFYEVAIASGYAFSQASLLALVLAARQPHRALLWLTLASLGTGLAAGSRPNLMIGAAVLLPLSGIVLWRRGPRTLRSALGFMAAGGIPAGLIAAALLGYNHARFDRAWEFGNTLQLGANPQGFGFTLGAWWHNLQLYYFTLPSVDWYFPFVAPGAEPSRPTGYFGVEELIGQSVLLPAATATAICAWILARRRRAAHETISAILGLIAIASLVNFCLVAATGVRANRYLLDFQPPLLALAAFVMMVSLSDRAAALRRFGRFLACSLLAAAAFNSLASLQAGEQFRLQDPAGYAAVERWTNRLVAPVMRLFGPEPGGQRYRITFPADASRRVEPLLVAGGPATNDALTIEFLDPGQARLGFTHRIYGTVHGPAFAYRPATSSVLRVHLGTLYPPIEHPWYGDLPIAEQYGLRQHAAVWLDDRPVLLAPSPTHVASPARTAVGQTNYPPQAGSRFSGALELIGPDPMRETVSAATPFDAVVTFPAARAGQREPILTYGSHTGSVGDAIFVEYHGPDRLRFGYDASGQIAFSPEIQLDLTSRHRLGIEARAGRPESGFPGAIRLTLNGDLVWSAPLWNREIAGASWLAFVNPRLSTSCRTQFTGVIHELVAGPGAPPTSGGRLELPAFRLRTAPSGAGLTTAIAGWTLPSGERAHLAIETDPAGAASVVWRDAGSEARATLLSEAGQANRLVLVPHQDGFALLQDSAVLLRHRTPFFQRGSPSLWVGGESPRIGVFVGNDRLTLVPGREVVPRAPPADRGNTVAAITLVLPTGKDGSSEPLLVAGAPGRADSLYVRYVNPGRIILGFDHWGGPGAESPPITVDPERVLRVRIDLAPLADNPVDLSSDLRVFIDGTLVWATQVVRYAHPDGAWIVGENPVGLSTSSPRFSGIILGP